MIDTLKNSPISNLPNSRHTDEHSNAGAINDIPSFSHFSDGSVSSIFNKFLFTRLTAFQTLF